MDRVRVDFASAQSRGFDVSEYQELGDLAREGLEVLKDAPPERWATLMEMEAFADWLVERTRILQEEWEAHRGALRASGDLPGKALNRCRPCQRCSSKMIGDKRRWRQYKARTRQLPENYRTAIDAVERYPDVRRRARGRPRLGFDVGGLCRAVRGGRGEPEPRSARSSGTTQRSSSRRSFRTTRRVSGSPGSRNASTRRSSAPPAKTPEMKKRAIR